MAQTKKPGAGPGFELVGRLKWKTYGGFLIVSRLSGRSHTAIA